MADFLAMGISDGAAAKRSLVQLWNPVGSGKIVTVSMIGLGTTNWPKYYSIFGGDLRVSNAPLPTLIGKVANKIFGGPVLTTEIRGDNQTPPAPFGPPIYEFWVQGAPNNLTNGNDGGSPMRDFPFDPPLVIPPGFGALIASAKPDTSTEPRVWWIVNVQGSEVAQ